MNLYSYDLSLYPLDWEFCFLSIDEYKEKLKEKYSYSEAFYKSCAGELSEVFAQIDTLLEHALTDWKEQFPHSDTLRCPPMIFPVPKGDDTHAAVFCVILKRENDGDTIVYSPIPLPHLEGC